MPRAKPHVLITWIGKADLSGPDEPETNCGPLARILADPARAFDRVFLLNDWGGTESGERYRAWLSGWLPSQGAGVPELSLIPIEPCAGKPPGEIYDVALAAIEAQIQPGWRLALNVSSGVTKMAVAFYLLSATRFVEAELVEPSKEQSVQTLPPLSFLSRRYPAEINNAWLRQAREHLDTPTGSFARWLDEEIERCRLNGYPVLLVGEPGTGKRHAAEKIVDRRGDTNRPAYVYCTSTTDVAAEAKKTQPIVLLSVHNLTLERQFDLAAIVAERVGSKHSREGKGGVGGQKRVVATTSRNLWEEVRQGRFHEDLLYRLAVNVIDMRPLQRRPQEIEALAEGMLQSLAGSSPPATLTGDAVTLLRRQAWPGNLRELQSVLMRAVARSGPEITAQTIRECLIPHPPSEDILSRQIGEGFDIDALLDEVKQRYMVRALEATGGVQSRAADLLGVSRSLFHSWGQKLAVTRRDGPPSVE